jgi:DNA invertase Pin-like site-specific DNA recombinase
MSQFRYLGMTVTNQNLIQEEIKRRLNCGNACYQSVQNLLSSHLLSKNMIIRIYHIFRQIMHVIYKKKSQNLLNMNMRDINLKSMRDKSNVIT